MRTWRCRERSARTPCCRPRSSTTPTARKCGATSATSTGRARKRLSCWRKATLRQKAEQAAVDRSEADRDQPEAEEILRRKALAEERCAEADRDRRDHSPSQQSVGRPGGIDQTEIHDVAERGAGERQRDDRAPGGQWRGGGGARAGDKQRARPHQRR